ncbi:MAG: sulfotransferase [Paracoccaceae bacterium]
MRASAVDILGIGAQRAMTSWLHAVLSRHPRVWAFPDMQPLTSTNKEAHYWDWNRHRGPAWYRVVTRPLDDTQLSLDITPEYAFLDADQIAECKALSPTARVIYLLRDPLARAVSAIRMHATWASNNADPKDYAITFGPRFQEFCRSARLIEHAAYVRNILRWRAAYPDLLILSVEEIQRDPDAALDRLFGHIGLDLANLDDGTQARIRARARDVIWRTRPYSLDADCLNFLDGLTRPDRDAVADAFGLHFGEGDRLREALL